jgi:hypothetical protein
MIDEEIRKVRPNKEIAKSIFKMIKIRLEELETKDRMKFPSIVVEDYFFILLKYKNLVKRIPNLWYLYG